MKIDTTTILSVLVAMVVFKVVDKMVLSKIEFFNLEEDEEF